MLRASFGTRKLRPIDEGKKPFLAALRSSFDSSARPADSGTTSTSSSSSASALFSGGVPDGIRKPVRYQFDGRTQPGSRSSARHGPPGTDEIQLQRLDQPLAHLKRGCGYVGFELARS